MERNLSSSAAVRIETFKDTSSKTSVSHNVREAVRRLTFAPAVSSDFSADEKMEVENIKMYKKELLDDIQVKMCRRSHLAGQVNAPAGE